MRSLVQTGGSAKLSMKEEEAESQSREMNKSKHRAAFARCAGGCRHRLSATRGSKLTMFVLSLSVSCCIWQLITGVGAQAGPVWSVSAGSSQRCSSGPPLQWRPHLDAPSKAHLAPAVALGTLLRVQTAPIQLNGGAAQTAMQQPLSSLAYHPQNINNVGFYIEATFLIKNLIKRTGGQPSHLRANQTVKLFYKISASLATTNTLMNLVNSNRLNQRSVSVGGHSELAGSNALQQPFGFGPHVRQLTQARQPQVPCAYELSEQDMRKASKMFQNGESYILFLDQSSPGAAPSQPALVNANRLQQQVGAMQAHLHQLSAQEGSAVQPFAPHEPLSNETSRAIRKILCKSCGKFQWVPLMTKDSASVRTSALLFVCS